MDGRPRGVLIVGLSGTGKTTTTFTTQLGSKPAQDDFIALMPDGTVHPTENGCFAKTFGLDPATSPPSTARPPNPRPTWRTCPWTPRGRSTSSTPRLRKEYLTSFAGLDGSIVDAIA